MCGGCTMLTCTLLLQGTEKRGGAVEPVAGPPPIEGFRDRPAYLCVLENAMGVLE